MAKDKNRAALARARRIVVKVGSRSLALRTLAARKERFAQLASSMAGLHDAGKEPILVSSGAIALGMQRLGLSRKPRDIATLQAAAAAGQASLVRAYEEGFDGHPVAVAQVLLTHSDFADRERHENARHAIEALLRLGALPIVNENDTISVDEIRFGDNDALAAMVAGSLSADLLVLLTDVEGLLDGAGKRVPLVPDVAAVRSLSRRSPSGGVGTGGMASKLEAAGRAARAGVPTVIASASEPGVIEALLKGRDVGTLVLPKGPPLARRKHWIAYTLRPRGTLIVDEGAAKAMVGGRASLLVAGVIGVSGNFNAGDPVWVRARDGHELARGLVRYDVSDLASLAGGGKEQLKGRIGYSGPAIHKDDLVLVD